MSPSTHHSGVDALDVTDNLIVCPAMEAQYLKAPDDGKGVRHETNIMEPSTGSSSSQEHVTRWESLIRDDLDVVTTKEAAENNITTVIFNSESPKKEIIDVGSPISSPKAVSKGMMLAQAGHPTLRLPRELRDEVYKYLLCNTYFVDLPPVGDAALRLGYCANAAYEEAFTPSWHHLAGPHLAAQAPPASPPASIRDEDIMAPWMEDTRAQEELDDRNHVMVNKKRWNLSCAESHLPILRVSGATYAETRPLLYKEGTFCFLVSEPRKDRFVNDVVVSMRKVRIHIDLPRAYERHKSHIDQACALQFATRIMWMFSGTEIKRDLCIIHIMYPGESRFLQQSDFVQAIGGLNGFEKLELRFTPPYLSEVDLNINPTTFAGAICQADLIRTWDRCVRNITLLEAELQGKLGRTVAKLSNDDFSSMVFHPRKHWEAAR